jgi:hypothetical protein
MTDARFEMKLRNGSIGVTKRPDESQHHRTVHDERKLHANRTSLLITVDVMATASTTPVASASIASRTHDP